ncbi:TIR-like protein FxsC [Streptomyces sp. NPDC091371]|uniref:TIR-like protein FxsC n=1 Tax=Streptomyces sp. NPDC091371 TaxID=3155303 RepID=UPI003416FB5E
MSGPGRPPVTAADRLARALLPFRDQWIGGDAVYPRLGARILVDGSRTMSVWRGDLDAFIRSLTRLRAFHEVRTGRLHSVGILETRLPGGPAGDRLVLLVSDCASPRWRRPEWWQELYALLRHQPTALINPLPPKLWRRTGLDLPAVRVEPPRAPVISNAGLKFRLPPLLGTLPGGGPDEPSWLPLPVASLTAHSLGQWAESLTGSRPLGCDALLVPGPAAWNPPPLHEPPRTAAGLTDSFLLLASPRAARLAVLCAAYTEVDLAQLRSMAEKFEPEATTSDLAEILVGGLFSVSDDEPTTLRFHSGVREHVQSSLGVRDVRLLRERLPYYAGRLVERRRGPRPAPRPGTATGGPVEATAITATARPGGIGRGPGTRAAAPPYFFLSYAHTPRYGAGGPDPDMWVERLFRDLCAHVMAMTDLPAGYPVGFMDREVRSGEGWSDRLGEALATSRVFVPLFSPRYFASEACGKEWYAFAQRAVRHRAASNERAEAIVPALWVPVPPSRLPGFADGYRFDQTAFGPRYLTDGLYGLIKLRGYAEQYERAVYELAKRIVKAADSSLTPVRPLDYRTVPSAFGASAGLRGSPTRSLHVVVAAASRHDLPEGRSPEYYGDSALDWNPYHPESQRPIAHVIEDLARNLNYRVTLGSFDDEVEQLDTGQPPARPEILLLDRWAVEDERRRRRLAAFDQGNRPWVNVVVPWNRYDYQGRGKEAELARRLEETLPVTMGQGRAACRAAANGVASVETLGQILPQVVEAAAQQFLRHAEVYAPAPGTHTERPRLLGPQGMHSPPPPDD